MSYIVIGLQEELIFTYVSYIVIGLQEEPANCYKEKRSVALVTGHLFTFLVVLSPICLMTGDWLT